MPGGAGKRHCSPAPFVLLLAVAVTASIPAWGAEPLSTAPPQSATTVQSKAATPAQPIAPAAPAKPAPKPEADALYAAAEKAQQDGYFNQSIDGYRKFAKAYPKDDRVPWAFIQIGDLLAQQSQERDAIAAYGEVIRVRPDSMEAKLARTRLSSITEGVLGSIRESAKSATVEEEKIKSLWEIGHIYEMMQDFQQAAVAYQDVKRATTMESWRKKANEKLAEIVEARVKRQESGPPVPDEDEWKAIAELAETAEAWPRASEYYRKLSEAASDPGKKAEYRLANARALQHWGKQEKAFTICTEVLNSDIRGGQREEAYQCAGTVLEGRKEYAKALKLYEKFLTEAENEQAAAVAMLRKAFCLERMGSADKALNTYRDIVDRYPKAYTAPEALIGIGRIYEARREYPAARTSYSRVVTDYPDSHKVVEAKSLIQALTAKEADWERVKAELGRMSERYPRRERKDGEGM